MDQYRRVVAAHDKEGRSVIASDTLVPNLPYPGMPSVKLADFWTAANMHFPDGGVREEHPWWFPPVGGIRYAQSTMGPHTAAGYDSSEEGAAARKIEENGMHRSASLDVIIILEGTCVFQLEDGEAVTLNTGDSLINCGSSHAWSNPFDQPCRMISIIVGAINDLNDH